MKKKFIWIGVAAVAAYWLWKKKKESVVIIPAKNPSPKAQPPTNETA